MGGDLRIRLERAGASAELSGDAAAVQAALADLRSNGVGALGFLFGGGAAPGSPPLVGQILPGASSSPTAPSAPVGTVPLPVLKNPAASFRFVVHGVKLPSNTRQYAVDVDGDGRAENGFANIISALAGQSIDLQSGLDAQFKSAASSTLITVLTETATPAPDQAALVMISSGKTVDASQRVFASDPTAPVTTLSGRIVGGRFQSEAPRHGGAVVARSLALPIGPSASPLPVQGLEIAFDIAADGATLSNGQWTGSVKHPDFQAVFLPALAEVLLAAIQGSAAIAGPISKVLGISATSGQSAAADALAANPLIRSLIAPDVQIWDLAGAYAPNPLHGMPDSLSIGIGFSATRATY